MALDIVGALARQDASNRQWQMLWAQTRTELAVQLAMAGNLQAAFAQTQEAQRTLDSVVGVNPEDTWRKGAAS